MSQHALKHALKHAHSALLQEQSSSIVAFDATPTLTTHSASTAACVCMRAWCR